MPEYPEQLAKLFKCIGHPIRIRILRWIMEFQDRMDGPPQVPSMIATELEISVSDASYHLNRLFLFEILDRKISGRYTFYTLNDETLKLMEGFFNEGNTQ